MNQVQFDGSYITPSKIVCVGRNYVAHAEELGNAVPEEPVFFIKPNSAISETIISDRGLHYEGELCFLILDQQIAAVGFGLDLTDRTLQAKLKAESLPWERAKAFRGAALFSEFCPWIEPSDSLRLRLHIDGSIKQAGGVAQMLHKPEALVDEVESVFGWEDGDILMTGTPAGVGPLPKQGVLRGEVFAGDESLVEATWECA